MPKYYVQQLWDYEVESEPVELWRKVMYLLHINFPYFVGDKITLKIRIKKKDLIAEKLNSTIRIGGSYPNAFIENAFFKEREIPFIGEKSLNLAEEFIFTPEETLSKNGTTFIYARKTSGKDDNKEFVIFSADVYHDEFFQWFVIVPILVAIIFFVLGKIF